MLDTVDQEGLTIMGRMALTHLAAEHVLPVLAPRPATQALVREVIEVGWSWMETRQPDPSFIYWTYNPRLMEDETHYVAEKNVLASFFSAFDMHYFMIWRAEYVTRIERPGIELSLGNDISEIDGAYLDQCLQHTVEGSPRPELTEAWLGQILARLRRECPVRDGDVIGKPVERASFDILRVDP